MHGSSVAVRSRVVVAAAVACVQLAAAAAAAGGGSGPGAGGTATPSPVLWRHGHSHFGELAYPADFAHFAWVNPLAPRGGRIVIGLLGSWDSFNPFIVRGRPAAGVAVSGSANLLFDRLLERTADDATAAYGRLAESVAWAGDQSWMAFRLRAGARWHDGTPITAADVAFTLEQLRDHAAPNLRMLFRGVTAAVVGERELRFDIAPGFRNASLLVELGQIFPLQRRAFAARAFDATWPEAPPGSGPYRVAASRSGQFIEYERVDDWWGADLPVNRGRFNFDRIRFEYFLDVSALRAALRAGAIDAWLEYSPVAAQTEYDTPDAAAGLLRQRVDTLQTGGSLGGQPVLFNTRLAKFADVRVREALALVRPAAWTGRVIHAGAYTPVNSFFAGSRNAAVGLPGDAELALLAPLRDRVPARVFTTQRSAEPPEVALPQREREQRADALLRAAGWTLRDGRRVHAQRGEALSVELLVRNPSPLRGNLPWLARLERLGIATSARLVEQAQYVHRLRNRDFEVTSVAYGQSLMPGSELRTRFGSGGADLASSDNYIGVRDAAVDALVEAAIGARSQAEHVAALQSLDRVLSWSFYAIPGYAADFNRLVYWDRFGFPDTAAAYFTDYPTSWWFDAARDARVRAVRAGR